LFETIDDHLPAGNSRNVTGLAGSGRLLFIGGKIPLNMTGMVEINARAPLVRITGKFRVPFGEASELDLMTNLALGFGKMSNVKIFTMMLLVAGRAGELARFHSTNISDGRPGPE
jgi:hypothetical protein